MKLYMMLSQDRYSYPVIMTTSVDELARLTGANKDVLNTSFYKNKQNEGKATRKYRKWERITIPDDMSIELVTDEMWEHYQTFCQHRQKDKEQK